MYLADGMSGTHGPSSISFDYETTALSLRKEQVDVGVPNVV